MKYLTLGFIFLAQYWWVFVALAVVAVLARFILGAAGPQ